MATHILTVNRTTFKTHLNYMFLGTGKKGSDEQEGALIDILGIREDDNIIFYVMNYGFYGIFKASGNVFYDYKSYENCKPQYLDNLLDEKTLTYRMQIEAKEVYKKNISEWDMMENPAYIEKQSIYNLQWSWIFKKLNASRGCLSIDDYEFNLFKKILSTNNEKLSLVSNYDFLEGEILVLNNSLKYNPNCTNVKPKNESELLTINKESDLRRLFAAKARKLDLLDIVLNEKLNGKIKFISNEVLCSFSERKIDLLFGTEKDKCILIELKNEFVYNESIYYQLKEYARWISAYKIHYKEIIPILILKEPRELSTRKGSIYFKYLSEENKKANITSDWYNHIKSKISQAQINLKDENISKLSNLKVYVFKTDSKDKLISFSQI